MGSLGTIDLQLLVELPDLGLALGNLEGHVVLLRGEADAGVAVLGLDARGLERDLDHLVREAVPLLDEPLDVRNEDLVVVILEPGVDLLRVGQLGRPDLLRVLRDLTRAYEHIGETSSVRTGEEKKGLRSEVVFEREPRRMREKGIKGSQGSLERAGQ